jgi:arylsulfatase A-like enzyme
MTMATLTRRTFLSHSLGGAAALTLGRHVHGAPSARRKPNIIFILADDLGYGDLGCYGQARIQTPHIDALAAEGMRFTDAYAGSTVCAPSRCALMTGMHTGHCTVRGNKLVPLRPEDTTVAEVLKAAGYTTGLIGKWGLGEPETTGIPNRKGFDYFYGYLNQHHAHNFYPDYLWRNEERVPLDNELEADNIAAKAVDYSHDLFAEEALDFVRAHQAEPFFLYLALTIPHANNERGRAKGDGMEVPSDAPYSHEDWPQPQKGHAAMITRMDRDVGRLIALLRALDLAEDTLVIFTSDNGPHKEGGADPEFFGSRGPLRGIKRDLYEGGIRVPAIAWRPGTVPAGSVSRHPWAFWDFLPTAGEIAGSPVPEGIDGISLLPTLEGRFGEQRCHGHLYWEFHEGGFKQAVRMGPWKAVRPGTGAPIEVYDLATDLSESLDLAAGQPALVAEAERLFTAARTESELWPLPPQRARAAASR